jgi:hypothetical protein
MKRSKLEEYINIVEILLIHGPTELVELENFVHVERFELRKALVFLLEQNAIEKNPSGTAMAYVASPLGVRLVNYFGLNNLVRKPSQ